MLPLGSLNSAKLTFAQLTWLLVHRQLILKVFPTIQDAQLEKENCFQKYFSMALCLPGSQSASPHIVYLFFISFVASQVPEERFTPLHFFKPHIGACFTVSGSCIITNPNDPREDQVSSLLFVPSKVIMLFRELITLENLNERG